MQKKYYSNNFISQKENKMADVMIKRAISSTDFLKAVDDLSEKCNDPVINFDFNLGLYDHFLVAGDRVTSLHFLNQAKQLHLLIDKLRLEKLVKGLLFFEQKNSACEVMFAYSIMKLDFFGLASTEKEFLVKHFSEIFNTQQRHFEHGHDLLISYLDLNLDNLKKKSPQKAFTLLEIGTTRENVPGQGSTKKLAEFCIENDLNFVTIDIDPHNTISAKKLFRELKAPFDAVTSKGEHFLSNYDKAIDFIFLDAYDFDHGHHSNLRQSRYEKFLGSAINDDSCHQMHLDCAKYIAANISEHSLVCIDDTWLEDGAWKAKGTLAVPFLLDSGFKILEIRNRAVLLASPHFGGYINA